MAHLTKEGLVGVTEETAPKILKEDSFINLTEQDLMFLLKAKQEEIKTKKEFKETAEKLPELDKDNFKINSSKRTKEVTSPNGVKLLENPKGDVREYLEGDYKGEQLFTYDSALRETKEAGKKLPASWKDYEIIMKTKYGGKEGENYQNFLKGENMYYCGQRDREDNYIDLFDELFSLRCEDGTSFRGSRKGSHNGVKFDKKYGFSVRCLKD